MINPIIDLSDKDPEILELLEELTNELENPDAKIEKKIELILKIRNHPKVSAGISIEMQDMLATEILELKPEQIKDLLPLTVEEQIAKEMLTNEPKEKLLESLESYMKGSWYAESFILDKLLYWLPRDIQEEVIDIHNINHHNFKEYKSKEYNQLKGNVIQTDKDREIMKEIFSMSDEELLRSMDDGSFLSIIDSFENKGEVSREKENEDAIQPLYYYGSIDKKLEPKKENLSKFYKVMDAVRFLPTYAQTKFFRDKELTDYFLSLTDVTFMEIGETLDNINIYPVILQNETFLKKYIDAFPKLNRQADVLDNESNPFYYKYVLDYIKNERPDIKIPNMRIKNRWGEIIKISSVDIAKASKEKMVEKGEEKGIWEKVVDKIKDMFNERGE